MISGQEPLCHIDDIAEGASKGFLHQGLSLFAIRQGDRVYAYQNQCPHLGLPLEWQADTFLNHDQSLIQCASHGALFEIDSGHCLAGPCQGKQLVALKISIKEDFLYLEMPH